MSKLFLFYVTYDVGKLKWIEYNTILKKRKYNCAVNNQKVKSVASVNRTEYWDF